MNQLFYDTVAINPIIAAVKDLGGLERCLEEENIHVVFVLCGDVCSIGEITERIKAAGKISLVHVDLITGLSSKEIAVDFIQRNTAADGIITTRQSFIRRAQDLHMYSILRVFVIDSIALSSLEKLDSLRPDFIEIMPGVMPKTIRKVCTNTSIPILAGGLIADKEDVMSALESGATAVSTTNQQVWKM